MGMFKSLRGKTVAIVIASVLIMALVMGGIFIPKQIAITSDVIEDYMIDVAVLAGESIDAAKELHGDSVLDPKALRGLIASVNVRDFPSSYCLSRVLQTTSEQVCIRCRNIRRPFIRARKKS